MSDDVVIKVKDVSMEFNLSQEKTDNLKEYVIKALKRELRFQSFWALEDISFEIKKGDKVGVVGLNGAGKSTLLKIISGVMKPTIGTVDIHGNIAPLLALGAGFDPNYTGHENIFFYGAILGHTREFMESKYDEIVEFVVSCGKASASLIQRRFRMGYNRAAHAMDLLEANGIIGPYSGSALREVLVKKDY